jgi:NADH-quinone oxidoreductase subunit J
MFEMIVFFAFATIAVVFALVVILHRNPVISAISLVATLFSLAVMYVLLEAPFLAALQVIIYAGAIMVLFLFVIMLLNLQRQDEERNHPVQHFLAFTGSAAFAITLILVLARAAYPALPATPFITDARTVGFRLFDAYLLPFEAVSILLLAAIVGALALTQRSNRRVDRREEVS